MAYRNGLAGSPMNSSRGTRGNLLAHAILVIVLIVSFATSTSGLAETAQDATVASGPKVEREAAKDLRAGGFIWSDGLTPSGEDEWSGSGWLGP